MDVKFKKNARYVFKKEKYYESIKKSGRKISTVEKNFGNKFDNMAVKVINESQGVVDGYYQVSVTWCDIMKN